MSIAVSNSVRTDIADTIVDEVLRNEVRAEDLYVAALSENATANAWLHADERGFDTEIGLIGDEQYETALAYHERFKRLARELQAFVWAAMADMFRTYGMSTHDVHDALVRRFEAACA